MTAKTSGKQGKKSPKNAILAKGVKSGKGAKGVMKFKIDASKPTNDAIFDPSAFATFLQQKIKVDSRTGNLGDNITVKAVSGGIVEIESKIDLSGRYIKYLTKKFLKKQQLRDWLRVVSKGHGKNEYVLKFFNVAPEEGDDEDEE